jgi:hypothetical protein
MKSCGLQDEAQVKFTYPAATDHVDGTCAQPANLRVERSSQTRTRYKTRFMVTSYGCSRISAEDCQ